MSHFGRSLNVLFFVFFCCFVVNLALFFLYIFPLLDFALLFLSFFLRFIVFTLFLFCFSFFCFFPLPPLFFLMVFKKDKPFDMSQT